MNKAFMNKAFHAALLLLGPIAIGPGALAQVSDIDRGRYLVLIGHCNNCHTASYMERAGDVPETLWLTGSKLGWRSAAGTTYATNLRIYVSAISEDAWVQVCKSVKTRPPMPWWSLHDTSEPDLRLMYRFIRGLGAAGEAAPAFLPPDKMPAPPFVQLPMPPSPER